MTAKRIIFLRKLMSFVGLEGRLHLAWISSAEAQRYVREVTEFTEKVRAMGPSFVRDKPWIMKSESRQRIGSDKA